MKNFEYAKTKGKNNKKKWWIVNTSRYSIYIWALPLYPFVALYIKLVNWNYNRKTWDEKKATKVLNCALPYVLEWVKEDNAFYYCMSWHGYTICSRAPFLLRGWAVKFRYKLIDYLKEGYENPQYIKTIENDGFDDWIKFEEKGLTTSP